MKPLDFLVRLVSLPIALHRSLAKKMLFSLGLFVLLWLAAPATAQQSRRTISFPTTIRWARQKGVARHRLQIAADENFHDIFFDGTVSGQQYTTSDLPAGYYYWRIAPADPRTGFFSRPTRFFVSGGMVIPIGSPDKAKTRPRVRNQTSFSQTFSQIN